MLSKNKLFLKNSSILSYYRLLNLKINLFTYECFVCISVHALYAHTGLPGAQEIRRWSQMTLN